MKVIILKVTKRQDYNEVGQRLNRSERRMVYTVSRDNRCTQMLLWVNSKRLPKEFQMRPGRNKREETEINRESLDETST